MSKVMKYFVLMANGLACKTQKRDAVPDTSRINKFGNHTFTIVLYVRRSFVYTCWMDYTRLQDVQSCLDFN